MRGNGSATMSDMVSWPVNERKEIRQQAVRCTGARQVGRRESSPGCPVPFINYTSDPSRGRSSVILVFPRVCLFIAITSRVHVGNRDSM
jgi:hypothetical protein